MKAVTPPIALVWMYQGRHAANRLDEIVRMDYPHFEVLLVGNDEVRKAAELFAFESQRVRIRTSSAISPKGLRDLFDSGTEAYVFWVDDDKPVVPGFLHEMVRPIYRDDWASEDHAIACGRPIVHFWSGNALCVPRSVLDRCTLDDEDFRGNSLLGLLTPILDVAGGRVKNRIPVALSSSEKLAPFGTESTRFLSLALLLE